MNKYTSALKQLTVDNVFGTVVTSTMTMSAHNNSLLKGVILGHLPRLPGYAGSHARAEDGRGQRRGGNPGRDEGLLQGGLQCGEPL